MRNFFRLSRPATTDHATGICFKDCEDYSNPNCKRAPSSTPVHGTIEQCCKESLPWIEYKYCTSRSKNEYSNAWFADWSGMKCSQDCDPAYGGSCKAHDKKENDMFDTATECCNSSKPRVAAAFFPVELFSHVSYAFLAISRIQLDGYEAVRCRVDRRRTLL